MTENVHNSETPIPQRHVRAFDRQSGAFRDFVITRIEQPELLPGYQAPAKAQPNTRTRGK